MAIEITSALRVHPYVSSIIIIIKNRSKKKKVKKEKITFNSQKRELGGNE